MLRIIIVRDTAVVGRSAKPWKCLQYANCDSFSEEQLLILPALAEMRLCDQNCQSH